MMQMVIVMPDLHLYGSVDHMRGGDQSGLRPALGTVGSALSALFWTVLTQLSAGAPTLSQRMVTKLMISFWPPDLECHMLMIGQSSIMHLQIGQDRD